MQITLKNFFVTYMHYFAISIGSLVAKKNCLFVVKDGHHASKDANDSAMGWMIASVPGAFRSRAARKIKFSQLRRTKCPTAAFRRNAHTPKRIRRLKQEDGLALFLSQSHDAWR